MDSNRYKFEADESVADYHARIVALQEHFKNIGTLDENGVMAPYRTAESLPSRGDYEASEQLRIVKLALRTRMKSLVLSAKKEDKKRLKCLFRDTLNELLFAFWS